MARYFTQKFQWFFDMATSHTAMQEITINAGGKQVVERLAPFFSAFHQFKLNSIRVRFVPAQTLPVDATGVSISAGANQVEPQDLFNPGLVRITNGEDFGFIGNYASDDAMNAYYAMLLDRRWFKFNLRSGFQRYAKPMFWDIAQTHQDAWPGYAQNIPALNGSVISDVDVVPVAGTNTQYTLGFIGSNSLIQPYTRDNSDMHGILQTGHRERLGWLPTSYFQRGPGTNTATADKPWQANGVYDVPTIEVMKIFLPKMASENLIWTYRVFVEESVSFRDPVAINPLITASGVFSPLDVQSISVLQKVGAGGFVAGDPTANAGMSGNDNHNGTGGSS